MMKVDVLNKQGQSAGRQVELPDDIFAIEPNEHVLYLAVKQYLAAKRSGTHKAKERGEITGSTKKIKRQKGTGTARAGSMKNPLFRGGGRVFGPRPRKYSLKLNKKVSALAKKSALSAKVADQVIKVVEDLTLEQPKTKDYINVLKAFEADTKKSLYVYAEEDKNVNLSARNLQKAKVANVNALNVYDILNSEQILLSEKSVEAIVSQLSKN